MRYRLTPQRRYRQQRPRFVGTLTRERLNLLGVARASIAGRLRLYQAATVLPDIAVSLWDPDHTAQQSTLLNSRSRSWYDPMNEPGTGSLILQNDDVDLPLIQFKDLIDFVYRGQTAATMAVESMERNHIDPAEEAGQFTTISGRLHVVKLEPAVIYPVLGAGVNFINPEQDRHFNWAAVGYDDSGWANATVVTDVATAQGGWYLSAWAADFPDPTAQIIWASDGTMFSAGIGRCWFRQQEDFSAFGAGWYRFYLTADNLAQLYVNGINLVTTALIPEDLGASYQQTYANDIFLPGGITLVAVFGENFGDPAGIAWACDLLTGQGGVPTALVTHSSFNSRIVEYSNTPPGVTVGFALLIAISEAQARGVLTGLTVTFTASADSQGNPWPLVSDINTRVGGDLLGFAIELSQAGYVDFWMTPGMIELNAVIGGTRGA